MNADVNELVERFRKIMGPVASTLANEAAEECGGTVEGEKIVVSEGNLEKFEQIMKEKCGKIIGEQLAETILKGD